MGMTIRRSYTLSACCLVIYGCWWAYFLYFLYGKEYDNNYAGATASAAIGVLTVVITLTYLVGFGIAGGRSKENRHFFWFILPFLLVPWVSIFLVERLRVH